MCPAATESKSSNPSSKKKINKKIDSNFKNDREEESIKNQDPIQNSKKKPLNDEGSIENNDELNVSDEEAKEMFPSGWNTIKPYLRTVKQPSD